MLQNFWQEIGFAQSPFYNEAIGDFGAKPEGNSNQCLLIGRDSVIEEISQNILLQQVSVISGPWGVGKSSVVNVCLGLLKSHTESGVIVVPSVAINAGSFKDNADLFRNITGNVLESLRRFYLAYNTPTFIFRYLEQSPLRKFFNINSLTRIPPLTRRYVNRWQSQLDGSSKTGGIQIAGYGMEVGNDKRSLAELSEQDLFNMLGQIIAEFNKTFETKRIIFLIENLEECKDEELRHFLHTCRFLLERNNCLHVILVGANDPWSRMKEFYNPFTQKSSRHFNIKPITFDDFTKAIDARFAFFSGDPHFTSPLSSKIYDLLFKASHGCLRFVFNTCERICETHVMRFREIIESELDSKGRVAIQYKIDDDIAIDWLREIVEKEIESLEVSEKNLLKKLHYSSMNNSQVENLKDLFPVEFESLVRKQLLFSDGLTYELTQHSSLAVQLEVL